ncbi:ABC transporter permease [Micromonospora sp. NBC_01813]|uniref:ABC transporter permease n=1 Tax=Micromonospora sp. NBC_01813 TaxID=2975988 RepID=UPI002DD80536|nr:ABC transporter permease [Micromonospora sp. NBC_01813]WSA11952.1 ABC transporter permease [Micromonospora sp. NBC_01813]
MTRVLTVAEMTVREASRRRGVLVILLLFPLFFYLARRGDHAGQSIRFVCLGLGWALSTAALFAGNANRDLEARLRLSGYRPAQLWTGRLLALWAVGLALSVPYFLLVLVDQAGVRHGAIALIMVIMVAVSVPFGLAISAVLPRELEGTLILLTIVGLQMVLDPSSPVARVMPFWFSREIATYAIDHTDSGYLNRGLLHGVIVAVTLIALVALATAIRLRRRPHLRFG